MGQRTRFTPQSLRLSADWQKGGHANVQPNAELREAIQVIEKAIGDIAALGAAYPDTKALANNIRWNLTEALDTLLAVTVEKSSQIDAKPAVEKRKQKKSHGKKLAPMSKPQLLAFAEKLPEPFRSRVLKTLRKNG